METHGHKIIRLVEMLTSDKEGTLLSPRTDKKLAIPREVMDLMYFARSAGEAAELILDKNAASIKGHCPSLSRLAAIVANNVDFFDVLHSFTLPPITHIVAALNTEELMAHWDDDEQAHRDFIETVTWLAVSDIIGRLSIEMALSAMIIAFEDYDDLNMEVVDFAMNHMLETACSNLDHFAPAYMNATKDTAINIVKTGTNLNGVWQDKAIDALTSIDFESEINLTDKNAPLAEEVLTLLLEDSDPRNVAISVGWLAAIYWYTPYRQRVEEFFDLDLLENEDHQEDVDDENPDGLAA